MSDGARKANASLAATLLTCSAQTAQLIRFTLVASPVSLPVIESPNTPVVSLAAQIAWILFSTGACHLIQGCSLVKPREGAPRRSLPVGCPPYTKWAYQGCSSGHDACCCGPKPCGLDIRHAQFVPSQPPRGSDGYGRKGLHPPPLWSP